DDNIFSTIKVVSRHQDTQQYGTILPIELTNYDIKNTTAYKEYYAYATGVAAPKPNASARKKRDGSKRYDDDDDNDDEEEFAKINKHKDTESGGDDEEVTKSNKEDDEEETRQEEEESFDLIPRTPKGSKDEDNDEEDQD
nr:hypothetical protein [Tanacetum cinerariifolium]